MNIPELTNVDIPLSKRYDDFLEWISQQGNNNPEYLAPKLGVEPSIIDLFFELGALTQEEFPIIDLHRLDVGILYLIAHFNKTIRMQIYPEISTFLDMPQPLSAIRDFVDNKIISVYHHLLKQISGQYWKSISAYLKAKNLDTGLFNVKTRKFFFDIGKRTDDENEGMTINQLDYLAQIIIFDDEYEHKVLLNDQAKKDHAVDCKLLEEALLLIKGLVETDR